MDRFDPVFTKTLKQEIAEFAEMLGDLGLDVEIVDGNVHMASELIRYYGCTHKDRGGIRPGMEMENRWYASLRSGCPDFSVYADDLYPADVFACWRIYSRSYLRSLLTLSMLPPTGIAGDMGRIRSVVDLGCGLGYTTAALGRMFPDAVVVGTNFPGTVQARFATRMGKRYGFSLVTGPRDVGHQCDLIFASEYFEHIESPLDHLEEIIDALRPKFLIVANAFGAISVGHFERYVVGGRSMTGKEASLRFNRRLRTRGYEKVRTRCWNGRPVYWRKRI